MNLDELNSENNFDEENIKALFAKVGGENAGMLEGNLVNIEKTSGEYGINVRVFSAMRNDNFNTTDHLKLLAEHLSSGNKAKAVAEFIKIKTFYFDIINTNLSGFDENTDLQLFITNEFDEFRQIIQDISDDELDNISKENDYSIGNFSILGFGEILSAKIYDFLLKQNGIKSNYLDTTKLSENGEPIKNSEKLVEIFKGKLLGIIDENGTNINLMIPGYIANLEGGILNFFDRGYSDATASALSQAALRIDASTYNNYGFSEVVLNIQKSVDGFLTTDPRFLDEGIHRAKLVEEISVDLALRIIGERGAKAKLLNSDALNKEVINLLKNNIKYKVLLNNPFSDSKGTKISGRVDKQHSQVKFVLSRDDISSRYKYLVGLGNTNSLYIMGENLGLFEKNFLDNINSILVLEGINKVDSSIHFGLKETLVLSFKNELDSNKALDILHRYFFEQEEVAKVA